MSNPLLSLQSPIGRWSGLGPYYAMFPKEFAFEVIENFSKPGRREPERSTRSIHYSHCRILNHASRRFNGTTVASISKYRICYLRAARRRGRAYV